MKKKLTEESQLETNKSEMNHEKALELKAILDSEVFNEVLTDLKADLMIQAASLSTEKAEQFITLQHQLRAIDTIVGKLQSTHTNYTGEFE